MSDTYTMIDPPSPFATIGEWRAFLADLIESNAEARSEAIEAAIAEAEAHIAGLM